MSNRCVLSAARRACRAQALAHKGMVRKETGRRVTLAACTFSGANERIRTADLRITSALLYQLSHVGIRLLSEARVSSISEPPHSRKGFRRIFGLRRGEAYDQVYTGD